jgi:hypothetical protein
MTPTTVYIFHSIWPGQVYPITALDLPCHNGYSVCNLISVSCLIFAPGECNHGTAIAEQRGKNGST